jgi:hypothetical protein
MPALRFFWIAGVFLALPVSATTLATAHAQCLDGSAPQTAQAQVSTSCWSSNAGRTYYSSAYAGPYTVNASAHSSPVSYGSAAQARATYETDVFLTMLGSTGTGYLQANYSASLQADTDQSAYVQSSINGVTRFYRDSTGGTGYGYGSSAYIPFTYGEPIFLHIILRASATADGSRSRWYSDVSASLSLIGFTGYSHGCLYAPTGPCETTGVRSSIAVEAPEPDQGVLLGVSLAAGLFFAGRSRTRFKLFDLGHFS